MRCGLRHARNSHSDWLGHATDVAALIAAREAATGQRGTYETTAVR